MLDGFAVTQLIDSGVNDDVFVERQLTPVTTYQSKRYGGYGYDLLPHGHLQNSFRS